MSPETPKPHAHGDLPEPPTDPPTKKPTLPPVPEITPIFSKSSKSKAAKFSKQAKVFTAKSVKSAKSKGGKSGGKSGKALFQKSNKGYGWWSASGAVSYLNSGSDYTPIGLERKSSASVMHGTGWWIAVVTVVTCAGSLLF
jgi:hypothetical protein